MSRVSDKPKRGNENIRAKYIQVRNRINLLQDADLDNVPTKDVLNGIIIVLDDIRVLLAMVGRMSMRE